MKAYLAATAAVSLLLSTVSAFPQAKATADNAPDLAYEAVPNFFQTPAGDTMGELQGVATNSKGNVFVYARNGEATVSLGGSRAFAHGGSSLYEFAPDGKFIRQIGKQVYGFLAAQQVRVDRQDNIWVVDSYSSMVMKFAPSGRLVMLLGRKPESVDVPSTPDTGRGNLPGSGAQSDLFQSPTDVAWNSAGNIFVADGIGNARIAKFTRDGVFVKSWG